MKAGTISVTDIRQAYTNATIIGYKPLILCRGFSDESARVLAEKLNIKILKIQDFIAFSTPEELYNMLYNTMVDVLLQILSPLYYSLEKEIDAKFLEVVVGSRSLSEAAQKIGISVKDLLKRLEKMGLKRVSEHGAKNFNFLKLQALLMILTSRLGCSR